MVQLVRIGCLKSEAVKNQATKSINFDRPVITYLLLRVCTNGTRVHDLGTVVLVVGRSVPVADKIAKFRLKRNQAFFFEYFIFQYYILWPNFQPTATNCEAPT